MSPRTIDSDEGRGQLIIVAGIGLAVTLVVLALILNSVIYTGNLATRDIESGANDATKVQSDVKTGLGGVMDGVNDPSSAEDYSALESDFETGTADWRSDATRYSAVRGHSLRIPASGISPYRGVRIVDGDSGSFEPSTGSPSSWVVAPGVRARAFTMTVDGPVTSASQSNVENDLESLGSSDTSAFFYVDIDNGEWRLAIYDDGGVVKATVYDDASGEALTCSAQDAASSRIRIDLGAQSVNGIPCPAMISIAEQSGPYTIEFQNGDQITGTYDLTVDRLIDDSNLNAEAGPFTDAVDLANYDTHCGTSANGEAGPTYGGPSSATGPKVLPALYSAELVASFESQSVKQSSDIRVADRELSEGATSPRIANFEVTADGSSGLIVQFTIDWAVEDPDGNLDSLEIRVEDGSGTVADTATPSVSGSSASGTVTLTRDFTGTLPSLTTPQEISLTVSDGTHSRSVVQTHEADGNMNGCPP